MAILKVQSLAGLDVSGIRAKLSQPKYYHLHPEGVPTAILKSVEYIKGEPRKDGKGNHTWLQVKWDTKGLSQPWACGFSGWRDDCWDIESPELEVF